LSRLGLGLVDEDKPGLLGDAEELIEAGDNCDCFVGMGTTGVKVGVGVGVGCLAGDGAAVDIGGDFDAGFTGFLGTSPINSTERCNDPDTGSFLSLVSKVNQSSICFFSKRVTSGISTFPLL
jgi:hypothetical protein